MDLEKRNPQENEPCINASQALFPWSVSKNFARGVTLPDEWPPGSTCPCSGQAEEATCDGNAELSPAFGDSDKVCKPELGVDGVGGGATVPF
jgi:hypothetical protein